jgi:hypothetical protein
MTSLRGLAALFVIALTICFSSPTVRAQETTGGLQGTVKDPTGAVVPGAHIALTGTGLVGSKSRGRRGRRPTRLIASDGCIIPHLLTQGGVACQLLG